MRAIKRVYTPAALDNWISRLDSAWESEFTEEELKTGRRHYLSETVRELEITDTEAIIHAKAGDDPAYIVIDWETTGGPSIRSSLSDNTWGRNIAIAGLYELEELVADEASGLPLEKRVPPPIEIIEERKEEKIVSENRPVISLLFNMKHDGLSFKAMKTGEDGQMLSVFKDNSSSAAEREAIIKLTSFAKRSGFRYNTNNDAYHLSNLNRIPPFLERNWEEWGSHFTLQTNAEVEQLFDGIRKAELEIRAEMEDYKHARLSLQYNINGSALSDDDAHKLMRADNEAVYIKGHGLVEAKAESIEEARHLRAQMNHLWSGKVPLYMLFSLFDNRDALFKPSEELSEWRMRVTKAPEEKAVLPEFLRNYQSEGIHYLNNIRNAGCHPLLADEMGLGKTLQILCLMHTHPIKGKANLVVCPASVVHVWKNEAAKFFPEFSVKQINKDSRFGDDDEKTIWVTSYTQLRRNKDAIKAVDWGYAILDEAQFIKNPEAKVSQAAMTLKAESRIAVTGTPIENHYKDLWTLFRYLMPGLLGSRREFQDAAANPEFAETLSRQISPFILRRTKREVASDLPDKSEFELVCKMTDRQSSEYDKLIREGRTEFGEQFENAGNAKRMHFFTLLTRLRQVSCDPSLLSGFGSAPEHSSKLLILKERINELTESGHKVVVFSQFVQLIANACAYCSEGNDALFLKLTGKTRNRESVVQRFQEHEKSSVIFVSLKAGGTGITLHAADYVFLLDPWWNPAVESQAIDRVHRIGQNKPVFVYRLIAQNSIEEQIQKLKQLKRERFDALITESDTNTVYEDLAALLADTPIS